MSRASLDGGVSVRGRFVFSGVRSISAAATLLIGNVRAICFNRSGHEGDASRAGQNAAARARDPPAPARAEPGRGPRARVRGLSNRSACGRRRAAESETAARAGPRDRRRDHGAGRAGAGPARRRTRGNSLAGVDLRTLRVLRVGPRESLRPRGIRRVHARRRIRRVRRGGIGFLFSAARSPSSTSRRRRCFAPG